MAKCCCASHQRRADSRRQMLRDREVWLQVLTAVVGVAIIVLLPDIIRLVLWLAGELS